MTAKSENSAMGLRVTSFIILLITFVSAFCSFIPPLFAFCISTASFVITTVMFGVHYSSDTPNDAFTLTLNGMNSFFGGVYGVLQVYISIYSSPLALYMINFTHYHQ